MGWFVRLIFFVLFIFGIINNNIDVLGYASYEQVHLPGFWMGVWHGIISPVNFALSFVKKSIHFYEVHNNGKCYDIGFVLGVIIMYKIYKNVIRVALAPLIDD